MKLSENAEKVLSTRYYLKDDKGEVIEDWKGLCKRVCTAVSSAEEKGNEEFWKDKFYEMMYHLDFIPNSPTMFNAGKEKGMLSACFVLDIEDSMASILKTLTDSATIFKMGGGVGINFSALRPEGAVINTTGGTSSGPISFMRMFDTMTEVVKQGGKRRGALMGMIDIDHPDVEKFIEAKTVEGKLSNFNISIAMTDEFMDRVKSKEDKALAIWKKIIDGAWKNGEPGVVFIDTINSDNPVPHLDRVKCSNPCLTGDTMVAVADGRNAVSIEQLATENKDVPVYTRNDKGKPTVRMLRNPRVTSEAEEIIRINLDNGQSLKTTLNHKFMLSDGTTKEAKDLLAMDSLGIMVRKQATLEKVLTHSNSKSQEYYWIGGSNSKSWIMEHRLIAAHYDPKFTLWSKKVIHHKDRNGQNNSPDNLEVMTKKEHDEFHSKFMFGKNNPMNRFPEKNIFNNPEFQEEMRTRNHTGKKRTEETKKNLSDAKKHSFESNPAMLKLFQNIGKNVGNNYHKAKMKGFKRRSEIYLLECQGKTTYPCSIEHGWVSIRKPCEECGKDMVLPFGKREISFHRECYLKHLVKQNKSRKLPVYSNHKVVSIERIGKEKVYNGTVDEFHNFYIGHFNETINGDACSTYINTRQCGEYFFIPYGSCNLGSINLSNMVKGDGIDWDKFEKTIRQSVRFLDNVISINYYPIPEIKDVTTRTRPVGLGVMGFSDLLLKLGVRYDSSDGIDVAQEVMDFLQKTSWDESSKLGEEKGSFPEFKKTKFVETYKTLRNCQLSVIAPTGTLSLLASCSSGIEPNFSWHTQMHRMDTVMEEYHPLAYKYLKNKEKLPNYFVTSSEISPEWHIRMQAAFQTYTDNAISKTINSPHHATKSDVHKAYMLAWELRCKGLTYYREGSRSIEVLVKGDEKASSKHQRLVTHIHRDRQDELEGITKKIKTNNGNSYITVNFNEDGYPLEVFNQASAKIPCNASSEGLARMTSLALREGIAVDRIIKQLTSAKCSPGCVSCPDMMGHVLSDIFKKRSDDKKDNECPECKAQLETSEGCLVCKSCGWGKCSM